MIIIIEQATFIIIENKKCNEGKKIIKAYRALIAEDRISLDFFIWYFANFDVKDIIIKFIIKFSKKTYSA